MARGRRNTTDETRKQCFILYDDLQSYSAVGRKLNLAPNTVKNIVTNKDFIAKFNPLLQQIAIIKKDSNEKLLDIIQSTQYKATTELALGKLDSETLDYEIGKNGIRSLIALIGNSFDKGMAYERLQLDERKVDIAERTLTLKETELQARIDNPDAFNEVIIINEANEVARITRERKELEDYETTNLN